MTESQIERQVESRTNSLDRRLMNGSLTQEEYEIEMNKLDAWAAAEFRKAR